jgi:hypothetical protein
MPLPKEITFTLEGEPVVPPDPRKAEAPPAPSTDTPGGDVALAAPTPVVGPVFGPEFGGLFTIRMPTIADYLVSEGRGHAYLERVGVQDQASMARHQQLAVSLAEALGFFDTLAVVRPEWCSLNAPADDTILAIVRAYHVANERIAAAKKKPVADGGRS